MTIITRRRLIGGLATIPALAPGMALAAPEAPECVRDVQTLPAAAPAALAPETPLDRINRLTAELGEALEEWALDHKIRWHIVVPRASVGLRWYVLNGPPS
ncbi:hypothetical protein [Mesorhizobium sp. J428]|uniref:hypothetical protein n=1 Tax=Mesorhizobium sp. J428 TaxID=2898440 RepID=UPI002151D893|nr:hypothetical protein [Mesorhizobium sp. J428]MCR5859759.1 hypothetical protein [Mesorhizobium sp. J428]